MPASGVSSTPADHDVMSPRGYFPIKRKLEPGGPAFFAYSTNYLIDVQAGIEVDVEATVVNMTREVDAAKKMIERVEERFEVSL